MPRVPDIWPNYNHSFAGPSFASSLCRLFTLYTSPNFLPCSRNNYNGRQRFKFDHPWAKASDAFIQSVVGRFNIHVSLYSVLRLKADIAACCLVVCTPVLNLMWFLWHDEFFYADDGACFVSILCFSDYCWLDTWDIYWPDNMRCRTWTAVSGDKVLYFAHPATHHSLLPVTSVLFKDIIFPTVNTFGGKFVKKCGPFIPIWLLRLAPPLWCQLLTPPSECGCWEQL